MFRSLWVACITGLLGWMMFACGGRIRPEFILLAGALLLASPLSFLLGCYLLGVLLVWEGVFPELGSQSLQRTMGMALLLVAGGIVGVFEPLAVWVFLLAGTVRLMWRRA